jgi:copper resistance protein C
MVWLWPFLLCGLLAFPSIVLPHAALVKSIPPQRAQLFKAPTQIQLWFNEKLEARFSSVAVIDSKGKRVDRANAAVDTDDPKRLSVGVNPLRPGPYKVRFRVLSVDGHVVEDEFPFTIRETPREP